MPLTIGVPREASPGETRVALTPDAAGRLIKKGAEVRVEAGAGAGASFDDAAYEAAGARVVDRTGALGAGLVLTVQGPGESDMAALGQGSVLVGLLRPLDDPSLSQALASRGVTAIAMELIPRTTRAQRMDVLSAMSTVAGYKAVLLAADLLPRFFPLLTTAAGTIRPARVLILGAGVAGLQALATARRLGAITAGYDVRPVAREQVESVGAKFVELELDTSASEDAGGYAKALAADEQARQVELLARSVAQHDVVIATALIPGRPAPRLITSAGAAGMPPGGVIVDLAAPNGGNCEATRPGETIQHAGVTIAGPLNLPAGMPMHASQLYGGAVVALVEEFMTEDGFRVDMADDILAGAVVAHGGQVVNDRVRSLLAPAA